MNSTGSGRTAQVGAARRAVRGLKFSAVLLERSAVTMVAARPAGLEDARRAPSGPMRLQAWDKPV
ncbi:hypothetical protein AB0E81_29680 [Streptomyces sp. NPDC033538]|uniref:hypothetical protein n=1 Tax=Streptomyces sp. NPDC033538 TaxID=3155367 RepID=UPI0033CB4826